MRLPIATASFLVLGPTVTAQATKSSFNGETTATAALTTTIATTTTATNTATINTSKAPGTATTTSQPGPTFGCDQNGYLIHGDTLYAVNLDNGQVTSVAPTVGGGAAINAMGYNVVDNYLYAADANNNLLRIAADGTSEVVDSLTMPGADVGDVDTNGFYWYGNSGSTYGRIDLRPGSPTYGWLTSNGTANNLGMIIADWAYIPLDPDSLYTIAVNSKGGSTMMKFSTSTKEWEIVEDYPDVSATAWAALYGSVDGTLLATDSGTGDIWAFSIIGLPPNKVTKGPASGINDGARCALAI